MTIHLWLTWARTRLLRQHRIAWWEVKYELRDGPMRDRLWDAIKLEIDRRANG
jgi:hypothetical protein